MIVNLQSDDRSIFMFMTGKLRGWKFFNHDAHRASYFGSTIYFTVPKKAHCSKFGIR